MHEVNISVTIEVEPGRGENEAMCNSIATSLTAAIYDTVQGFAQERRLQRGQDVSASADCRGLTGAVSFRNFPRSG